MYFTKLGGEAGTPSTDRLSSQDRLRKEFYGSVPKDPRGVHR